MTNQSLLSNLRPLCCLTHMHLISGFWAWRCHTCNTLVSIQPIAERSFRR